MRRSKTCGVCGKTKIVLKSGATRCASCHNRWIREYYQKSERRRQRMRETYLRRKYGLDFESLKQLLLAQGGRCAICQKHWQECTPAKSSRFEKSFLQYLYVDHEHMTGRVRGLLCNNCNAALGLFGEDCARLELAKKYLS